MTLLVFLAIILIILFPISYRYLDRNRWRRISRKCPEKGHSLKKNINDEQFRFTQYGTEEFEPRCDKCEKLIPEEANLYSCRTCDYDLCENCQPWQLKNGKAEIKAEFNFNMIPKTIFSLYHLGVVYVWHEVDSFETVAKFAPHILGAIESFKISDVERETGELISNFNVKNVMNYLWSHPMTGYTILSFFDIHVQMIDARFGLSSWASILVVLKLGYGWFTGRLFPKCPNNHSLGTKISTQRYGQYCRQCPNQTTTLYRCEFYEHCEYEICANCHPWDLKNKLYRVGAKMQMEFENFDEIFKDYWRDEFTPKEFFFGENTFYLKLPWIVLVWASKKIAKMGLWTYHLIVVFFFHGVCDFETAKLLVPHIILAYQSFKKSNLSSETGVIMGTFTVDNFKKVLFSPTALLLGIHLHKLYTFFTNYSKSFGESTWCELLKM